MKTTDEQITGVSQQNLKNSDLIELYNQYRQYAFNVAYKMLRNKEDAEDAVQNSFLKLAKYLPASILNNELILKSYLFKAAKTTSLSMLKQKKKKAEKELSFDESDDFLNNLEQTTFPQPDVLLEQEDMKEEMINNLSKLHETHRNLISLFYYEEVPYKDIVLINKMSMGTVKSQLFRAKQSLKRKLETAVSQ